MPTLRVENHWLSAVFAAHCLPLTTAHGSLLHDRSRRRATIEFSPVFQGWDQASTYNLFVASATVVVFNRRLGEEHPPGAFFSFRNS